MATLPEMRSELGLANETPPLSRREAVVEAHRCIGCADAPCTAACPTGIDVAGFIRKIATGNERGAARTILSANILGMSCAHSCPVQVLCEGACVCHHRQPPEPPIAIGRLQAFATDTVIDEGRRLFAAGKPSGFSVGVVGAGPAGLAAAHELRRLGHACTIYEKGSFPGGLNTTGIAPYKLTAARAVAEAEWLLGIGGIDLVTDVRIPDDLSWEELEARHDALFIGTGLGPDRRLGLPGEDLPGVLGALRFIATMKCGVVSLEDVGRAVVIGGGNTAVDAVRELLRLGVEEVSLVYRGPRSAMRAYPHEFQAALKEGARAFFQHQPVRFEGGERVSKVIFRLLDEERRPLPGREATLAADLVLVAIGREPPTAFLRGLEGVEIRDGRIVVDETGATGRPGVFAAGDVVNGGLEVVFAVAGGREAARAIHRRLQRVKAHV